MSELIHPEVMDAPNLPAAVRAAAINAVRWHAEAEARMRSWAEAVVYCGLELINLKRAIGHGDWLGFVAEHMPEISPRHAQRYMQVAGAVEQKMGRKFTPITATEEDRAKLSKVIAKNTDATSWQQLLMDFGLGGAKAVQGSGKGAAKALPAPDDDTRDGTQLARADAARSSLNSLIGQLRQAVLLDKLHTLIDDETRRNLRAAVRDIIEEL